jgi:hypothetical protein
VLASAREDVAVIVVETGAETGAAAVLIAAVATATRVRSPRVSRAVRPPRRVRSARIGVPVVEVTGIAALVAVAVVVAVAVATVAAVASASRRVPWWS